MTEAINGELRQAFELRAMRIELDQFTNKVHLEQARAIVNQAEKARDTEYEDFHRNYDKRLDAAQRKLIDEAGRKNLDHTPSWARPDRFNRQNIRLRAEHAVRCDYERRMNAIDKAEHRDLSALYSQAKQAREAKGLARDSFKLANEDQRGPHGPHR
ncbi:hypothetical protein [Methylocella sp.]|uniref:hypothetical protein n=1 Tax=Methylocella sp. TaxID=1978226 RepID=UPI00378362F6